MAAMCTQRSGGDSLHCRHWATCLPQATLARLPSLVPIYQFQTTVSFRLGGDSHRCGATLT